MILLLLGCLRNAPVPAPLEGPMLLGWRLVPGEMLALELRTHAEGRQAVTRVEQWQYLVTEVDGEGVATLEGRLTGLGAELRRDGEVVKSEDPVEQEKARLAAAHARLRLDDDGRLVELSGLERSDALPHRLLALQLSSDPVQAGDRWPDPTLASPWIDLLPAEVAVEAEGEARLVGLTPQGVVVASRAAVRPGLPEIPAILLQGEAVWDPVRGRLASRWLEVALEGEDDPLRMELRAL